MAYTYSDSSSRGGKAKPTVPSKHEAQVNYDNLLELGETYTLGEYTFTVTATTIPQTGLIDVIARATGPQGKIGAKTKQIPSGSEIKGWYVEANDTTADIYVVANIGGEGAGTEYKTSATTFGPVLHSYPGGPYNRTFYRSESTEVWGFTYAGGANMVLVSKNRDTWGYGEDRYTGGAPAYRYNVSPESITVDGFQYYWNVGGHVDQYYISGSWGLRMFNTDKTYAAPTREVAEEFIRKVLLAYEQTTKLIGRFSITAQEAGATAGTGGEEAGWEDVDDGQEPIYPGEPGYPDPEDPDYPGDDMPYFPPSKTLTVTINGALSGRHNDPLNDTSYSYLPSDQIAQTQYGSGGIGGNGGGGGAGASTIIVRKFATKKADSKTFVLKPKRHGYGSGGGKGGKGGDGCILIYY